ncbi:MULTISPECIES: MarR family transcriptional regulator [unclassified Coleofasciculus]|uniref:MarR family transcriptional regulator n=1 Tax=unclassified Coleofasciculus TaxID=2692782 RepID=UPI001880B78C|nr:MULTISPECIES: helix-turn-helix domain-containing protein [unclassified Coleofasciculus]MBE9129794.1 MarR family transcriptional regulator [Coleofasciculus sp. LEGE 07081]MBE9152257.1 MarR family transcriptional regulator [Coleofasciculus sp. LEGE 07092]
MDGLPAKGKQETPGLTMPDLLVLPDSQRLLINWMMRQGDCTVKEIAAHTQQNEEVVRILLNELIEKGFVEEIAGEDSPCYRVRMAPKRKSQLSEKLHQALNSDGVD